MAHPTILERDVTKLARPGRTSKSPHNVAGHGDTLLISFPKIPPVDGETIIYVMQSPPDETGNGVDEFNENIIGMFTAKLVNGKLSEVKGRPIVEHPSDGTFDKDLNLLQVHVVAPGPDGKKGQGPSIKVTLFPASRVHTKYSLRIRTFTLKNKAKPKEKASWEFWDASASLWVHYHLAMIVPSGKLGKARMTRLTKNYRMDDGTTSLIEPKTDVVLDWIGAWAKQWKRRQPEFREIFAAKTLPSPSDSPSMRIAQADFDDVVAKVQQAAAFAKHGIIALTTGHGDGSSAWFNLVPEDAIYTPVAQRLNKTPMADRDELFPSLRPIEFQDFKILDDPQRKDAAATVKQQALGRLAKVFENHPIRLFLLHTCNVGGNLPFLDRIAKEVQAYTAGHNDFITYSDPSVVVSTINGRTHRASLAAYDGDGDALANEYNAAEKEHFKSHGRVKELEQKLKTADPFDELRIRTELQEEREKRDAAKKRMEVADAKLKAMETEWPLHKASLQAPPNPGGPNILPDTTGG